MLSVILLMIGISLIRNIDPDTISLREALRFHWVSDQMVEMKSELRSMVDLVD
jgi:hypothetical protein